MKRSAFSLYYVLHYLPGLLLAGLLLHACGSARTVWADPLPELSARRFEKELVLMTAEYDKEVTQRQAESNPYLSERLILKSADPNLDPDEYGAVDAIQDRNGTYILQFESPGEARAAAHALSRKDSTIYVEPDGYLFACGFSTVLDEALWGSSANVIGADQYAQSLAGSTGTVEVAVLDTGISFTSPKLAGKLDTARAMSFATYEGDLLNVDQSQDSSTETKARHGTHVAGVIAQCTESLPNIRILPVRVLNNKGAGSVSQVANGIRYAADQGAAVINMSLSGKLPIGGATIRDAIDYAVSRGTIVVGVSGNNGTDVSAYTPGNIEECVVVGAVNGNDSSYPRWSGSNYGSTVDIVAPGVNVYGTVWENLSDGYNSLTGTSMASPHAAAAAAMIKLAHGSYGPAEIEHVLQQSVIDLGESGKDNYFGHGMIDLNSLLENDEVIQEEVADWQLQNMAAADAVTSMISALPDPLSLEDKNLVSQARSAYNALTYMQKRLVTNLSRLESAEASISKMEADYEAAQIVVERISDLPSEITLADKASVESARAAYESLTEDQKVYVTNLSVLTDAEEKIRKLEADIEAAQTVMERISDLPSEITLADKVTVESVRAAYEALSEDQKTLVTNLSVLISAEAKIIKLETDLAAAQAVMEQISNLPSEITLADRATVESARAAYDALSEDQKTLVTNLSALISAEAKITKLETDLAAAQAVMEQISDLPSEITLADRATVESARAAYDALTGDQKALVTNLSVLTSAEAKIKQEADIEAAQTVMERISDLPSEITLADKVTVESVRAAYEALSEDQKALVTNLSVLTGAEAKIRQQEALKEQEEAASGEDESSEYKDSRPVANVTYRVPLKKKQKTKVLKVTGLADGDYVVKWTSSARKKVKVTGRADGTCVIMAGSRTGNASVTALTASGKKVVFKLRVQNGKVKTKKLKTSKKTIRIGVGESIKLPVTRYPVTSVQKITYTSKNKAAARVAGDGTVTGAAPGTARIVVRSGNAKLTFTVITG